MKRFVALFLAVFLSVTSVTTSFADYKNEFAQIYTSLYGDMISVLENPRSDASDTLLEIKTELFKYKFDILYHLIVTTLVDGEDDMIAKELKKQYDAQFNLKANTVAPNPKTTQDLLNYLEGIVNKGVKEVEAKTDEDAKKEELQKHLPTFQLIQSSLLTLEKDLRLVLQTTSQYKGVSYQQLSDTTLAAIATSNMNITQTLLPYSTLTGSGTIKYNMDVDFDAANLRASIFDESSETLSNSYLEAIAITSMLEPFMSVPSDMLLYPEISQNTKEIIQQFGKKRKPLFYSKSSTSFEDYLSDKEMDVVPAKLSHLLKNQKDPKMLFYRKGNDEIVLDVNTVQAVPSPSQPGTQTNPQTNTGTGTQTGTANSGSSASGGTTPPSTPPADPGTVIANPTDNSLSPPVYLSKYTGLQISGPAFGSKRTTSDSSLTDVTNTTVNSMMFRNVIQDTSLTAKEKDSLLFIDIFGNIVTEQDIVVIPGIANASFYEPASSYPMTTKYVFNHYSNPEDSLVEVWTKRWNSKSMDLKLGVQYKGGFYSTFELGGTAHGVMNRLALNLSSNRLSGNDRVLMDLILGLYYDASATGTVLDLYENKVSLTLSGFTDLYPVVKLNKSLSLNNIAGDVINLSYMGNDDLTNTLLVQSHMNALQMGLITIRHPLLANLATEVAKGKTSMVEYKNELQQDEQVVGLLKLMLRSVISPLVNLVNRVSGFTHLGDPATHPVTRYVIEYREIITALAIICGMFLLLNMYNSKVGIPLALFATAIFILTFAIGIDSLLDYAITGYNRLVSIDLPLVRDDAALYRTIGLSEEQRFRRDDTSTEVMFEGDAKEYGVTDSLSLTLAKYDRERTTTKLLPLDLGMYMEGRSVKISTTDLFSTISVVDNDFYDSDADTIKREITIFKNYDTYNIENYTMFYDLVTHLTRRMTEYADIAEPKPKAIRYSSAMSKKAYVWRSIADSVLILDYKELFELPIPDDLKQKTQKVFPPNDTFDLENITITVYENDDNRTPTTGQLNDLFSLPYNSEFLLSLHNNYDSYPEVYKENYAKFVNKANLRIKDYLVQNYETITKISDETATKVISLIIMEEFSKQMTNPLAGQYMYPTYIDSSNLSLERILFATMGDLSWYNLSTQSLISALDASNSTLGYILLMISLPVIGVTLFLLSMFPFILLMLLFVLLFVRILMRHNVSTLLTGATKVLFVTLLMCFVMSKSILMISSLGWKLTWMTIVSFVSLDIMLSVSRAILFNMFDMGNSTLGASLLGSKTASSFSRLKDKMTPKHEPDMSSSNKETSYETYRDYKPNNFRKGMSYSDRISRKFGDKW